ncbi:hypothetical protein EDEG_03242 [Edhazardia aedis USNM 41457]|uniref:Uncharacterized protein n=1 Tax=Edhazardia aedis (strain USNM 41457) TaxID=1003232 RepID=J9DI87_EDHAE|nr:hypothetical protein EDEG_03242 [Edhazardia aedis USNM 41457]|eukprot:EJW02340.1 hypothetical protein EDEG_03242 [Edhazardia aedis USNM 41457]
MLLIILYIKQKINNTMHEIDIHSIFHKIRINKKYRNLLIDVINTVNISLYICLDFFVFIAIIQLVKHKKLYSELHIFIYYNLYNLFCITLMNTLTKIKKEIKIIHIIISKQTNFVLFLYIYIFSYICVFVIFELKGFF